MSTVLSEFIQILVSGITDLATGIAGGIIAMVKALFLDVTVTEGVETITGLSVFGGMVALFAGISLAVGLTSKCYNWVTSLGH